MTDHIVFDNPGTFQAKYAAEDFARSCGFSVGSGQAHAPTGLMYGDYLVAKWKNMSAAQRRALHATITGDGREGPVTLNIHTPCPAEGAQRLRAADAARRAGGDSIDALLSQAKARVAAMSPEARAAMHQAQRESFVRAMTTPCEHGELDWETCPQCRAAVREDGRHG